MTAEHNSENSAGTTGSNSAGTTGGNAASTNADRLESILTEPKRVAGDAGSVERYSAYEQIAVDKYLASKSVPKGGFPIRLVKITPDGSM